MDETYKPESLLELKLVLLNFWNWVISCFHVGYRGT